MTRNQDGTIFEWLAPGYDMPLGDDFMKLVAKHLPEANTNGPDEDWWDNLYKLSRKRVIQAYVEAFWEFLESKS